MAACEKGALGRADEGARFYGLWLPVCEAFFAPTLRCHQVLGRKTPPTYGWCRTAASALLASVNLVEVQFEPVGKVVFVSPGTTVLAAAEAAGVDIPCGCRRGMCGTDAVRVEPAEALAPSADPERSTLERMGLDDGFRLSCSTRVERGVVRVQLGQF